MRLITLIYPALLAFSFPTFGQPIELCGTKVAIGDKKENFELKAKPRCRFLDIPEKEMSTFWDDGQPSKNGQGSIKYEKGLVKSVSPPSQLFKDTENPVIAIAALLNELQDAFDQAGAPTKIQTTTLGHLKIFSVEFNGRNIGVVVGKGENEYATISRHIKKTD